MWETATPAELKRLTDQIGSGILMLEVCGDRRYRLLSLNCRIEQATGLRHEDMTGRYMDELLSEEERERVLGRYDQCVETGEVLQYEEGLRFIGRVVRWRTVLTPIKDDTGQVVRLMGSTIDVSDRHELEARLRGVVDELRESESQLQLALQGGDIGVFEWRMREQRVFANDGWAPTLNFFGGPIEMTSSEWIRIVHPDDRAVAVAAGERALDNATASYTVEYRVRNMEGDWRWLHTHGTVVEWNEDGEPARVCGTFRDITQQTRDREALRKVTEELQYQAVHDSMTGALNHGAIMDVLERELERARRDGGAVTVAFIDADHFKHINDSQGHPVGDEVLTGLVRRIRDVLRPYDHLGRYGGEEFMVIATGPGAVGLALYERLRQAVGARPVVTAAGAIAVTVSLGVAVCQGGSCGKAELVRLADRALYRAKAAGRNRVVMAEQADDGHEALAE
ncbi:diguanylate cyclase [Ectothiorhodospiraceae bacterium WFHF3C12]|nr:diguanylate cyclase [Ectothiorhodospiraceae bacterium WFHF3C12]